MTNPGKPGAGLHGARLISLPGDQRSYTEPPPENQTLSVGVLLEKIRTLKRTLRANGLWATEALQ
jgi:hypothetical protein